ncbi:MAG: hypothetical protein R3B41_02055 [Candidatus Doudnabacteria bacterium]
MIIYPSNDGTAILAALQAKPMAAALPLGYTPKYSTINCLISYPSNDGTAILAALQAKPMAAALPLGYTPKRNNRWL